MDHEEFLSKFYRDYGTNSTYVIVGDQEVYTRSFKRVTGMDPEEYYSSLIPNPGCPICGEELKFLNLRYGYQDFCSRSCKNVYQWQDTDYRDKMVSILRSASVSPEKFKNLLLRSPHSEAHVYLAACSEYCKFGVSTNLDLRMYHLDLELVCSRKLPIEEAAQLEYLISTTYPGCIKVDIEGYTETRPLDQLTSIKNYINSYKL